MVDLHCHILPGIDDGARNGQESCELIAASVRGGVDAFVFTPHFYPERSSVEEFLSGREKALAALSLPENNGTYRFKTGAEIMFTSVLADFPLQQLAFSGTGYLLIELSTDFEPYDVKGLIERLVKKGYVPILAHIERYPYLDPPKLYSWVRAGALTQVNAGWLLREKSALRQLEKWSGWGLVHLMASDCHSPAHRPPNLGEGYQLLPERLRTMLQENAEAVYAGKEIRIAPVRPERRLGHWR